MNRSENVRIQEYFIHNDGTQILFMLNPELENQEDLADFLSKNYQMSLKDFYKLSETKIITNYKKITKYEDIQSKYIDHKLKTFIVRFDYTVKINSSPCFMLDSDTQKILIEKNPMHKEEILNFAPCLEHKITVEKQISNFDDFKLNSQNDFKIVDVDNFMYGNPHVRFELI